MLSIDVRTFKDSLNLWQSLMGIHGQLLNTASAINVLSPFGMPDYSALIPKIGNTPNHCWGLYGNTMILLIDGVTSVAQGQALYASSQQPLISTAIGGVNATVLADATNIIKDLITPLPHNPANIIVSGYSYGGSLAQAVAAFLSTSLVGPTIQVAAFGSPRFGDSAVSATLAKLRVRRYMTDNDPVPRFPPHLDEAPAVSVLMGFTFTYLWSLYDQGPGGVQIDANGVASDAALPSFSPIITEILLTSWLAQAYSFGGDAHSQSSYLTRLSKAAAAETAASGGPTTASGPEPATPLDLPTWQASAAAYAAGLLAAQQGEGKSMLYIPVQFRPRVSMVSGVYLVIWMGNTIASCKTKSNAKTIAKYISKCCRELTDASPVYTGSMQLSWQAFLAAAANPANGFIPPLDVT